MPALHTKAIAPVIASGQVRGVMVVATYHPGAHIRGLTRDTFAAAVASSVAALGGTGDRLHA